VHLVGFTVEIYHDARSYKRQARDVSADNAVYQHSAYTKHRAALIARTQRTV